jgi:hypothetical protein
VALIGIGIDPVLQMENEKWQISSVLLPITHHSLLHSSLITNSAVSARWKALAMERGSVLRSGAGYTRQIDRFN